MFKIGVGIITNLMIFVPNLIIVELFRRTKQKHNKRLDHLNKFLNEWNEENNIISNKRMKMYLTDDENVKIKKKKFKFPWWFKIIIYLICLIMAAVSIFFIIIKGIMFGNEKVQKWITSLFISFLSSIFLTQPVKMVLLTFFIVALFRSAGDSEDIDDLRTKNKKIDDDNSTKVCK